MISSIISPTRSPLPSGAHRGCRRGRSASSDVIGRPGAAAERPLAAALLERAFLDASDPVGRNSCSGETVTKVVQVLYRFASYVTLRTQQRRRGLCFERSAFPLLRCVRQLSTNAALRSLPALAFNATMAPLAFLNALPLDCCSFSWSGEDHRRS